MKKTKPTSKTTAISQRKSAKRGRLAPAASPESLAVVDEARLLADLRDLVMAARQRIATVANSTHTMVYWHVGRRLLRENLQEGRATYGKRILATVSQELTAEYGDTADTVFRDPYFLDLLGLKGAFSERDLESAILREIEGVLLEFGSGFAFVARQSA